MHTCVYVYVCAGCVCLSENMGVCVLVCMCVHVRACVYV